MTDRTPLFGTLACATAAILWAASATTARTAIDAGVSPLELTEARAVVAMLAFGLIAVVRRTRVTPRVSGNLPSRAPTLLRVIAFGSTIAIVNLSYFIAIQHLPVAIAIVIQYTAPALVVAYVALIERRPPGRTLVVTLFAVLIGVTLTADVASSIRGTSSLSTIGVVAAIVSAFGFAAYNVLAASVTRSLGAIRGHAAGFGVATVIWVVVQAPRGWPRTLALAGQGPRIAFVTIAGTVLAFGIYAFGIVRIGASSATLIATVEPVATTLLGFLVLSQRLGPDQIVGSLIVLGAVTMLGVHTARTGSPA